MSIPIKDLLGGHPTYFIRIPKVATTTTEKILYRDYEWEKIRVDRIQIDFLAKEKGAKFFGLVRHPISRWISGMAQCFHSTPELLTDHGIGWHVREGWHDQHTMPQAWFYEGFPAPKTFKLENIAGMWDWLGIEAPALVKNATKDKGDQYTLYKYIQEQVPKYEDVLLNIYAEDLTLYNKAEG